MAISSSRMPKKDSLIGKSNFNEILVGTNKTHNIWGGSGGSDILTGALTSTMFWWGAGDGNDIIAASTNNGNNAMFLYDMDLSGSIKSLDINIVTSNGKKSLMIGGKSGNADGSIVLQNWVGENSTKRVQNFIGADKVDYLYNGTAGAKVNLGDVIYTENNIHKAVAMATTASCTLQGGLGADTLFGSMGSDLIIAGPGNDVLWGGNCRTDSDTLIGGAGHDIFRWGCYDGKDTVKQGTSMDTIDIYNVYDPRNVSVNINGHDLVIQAGASALESLTISNWENSGLNSFTFGTASYRLANNGWVNTTTNAVTALNGSIGPYIPGL